MKTHSDYGPSAAERWMNCPASVPLTRVARERNMNYEVPSQYAEAGTYAMALLEAAVKGGHTVAEAYRWRNEPPPEDFGEADLGALEVARMRIVEALEGADEWGAEEPIDIVPSLKVSGTCDFWARHGNRVTVIDYKHGAGVMVKAEGNKQLMLYALGFARRFPEAAEFRLAICQPRGFGWTEVTVDRAELEALRADVVETILFDVREPRIGPWCRWCPALLVCPRRKEEFRKMTEIDETAFHDAETLRFIIEAASRVTKLIEAAKAAALRRFLLGAEIEGLRLKEVAGRLVWKEGATDVLFEHYGDSVVERQFMSPARVRDTMPGGAAFVKEWADRKPPVRYVEAVDTASES